MVGVRGPIPEAGLEHGTNLLFSPPNSPDALADRIQLLMDNPELRNSLSCGARKLAAASYSWDGTIDRLEEILKDSYNIAP
jgi:glycosyltransferase involved in cell wall biosynthesis